MTFSLIQSVSVTDPGYGPFVTVNAPALTSVATGDLIVLYAGWVTQSAGMVSISDGTNSATLKTFINGEAPYYLQAADVPVASAVNSSVFTFTFGGTGGIHPNVVVVQFRPDSGYQAQIDQAEATGFGYGATPVSSSITTSGGSVGGLVIAGIFYDTGTLGSYLLGGSSADGSPESLSWYRNLAANMTGTAQATITGGPSNWAVSLLSYKPLATGGGGGGPINVRSID